MVNLNSNEIHTKTMAVTLGQDRHAAIEGVARTLAELIRQEPAPAITCKRVADLLAMKVVTP